VLVSASADTEEILRRAGLLFLIDEIVTATPWPPTA
jgi:hypothetical protein